MAPKPPVEAPPKPPSDIAYLQALAGAPSTGKATQSSGPKGDPGYKDAIETKIKSNLRFPIPADLQGNPEAVFEVSLLPNMEILSVKLVKTSGIPTYDEAAKRAINASSPLPPPPPGVEPGRVLRFPFRPKN